MILLYLFNGIIIAIIILLIALLGIWFAESLIKSNAYKIPEDEDFELYIDERNIRFISGIVKNENNDTCHVIFYRTNPMYDNINNFIKNKGTLVFVKQKLPGYQKTYSKLVGFKIQGTIIRNNTSTSFSYNIENIS